MSAATKGFVAFGVVGLLAAACTAQLAVRFPHQTHLTGFACGEPGQPACLACPSCHQGAADKDEHWARPAVKLCVDCHQGEPAKQRLPERPSLAPTPAAYAIVFNHDKHLEMDDIKGQCVTCHAGAVSSVPGKLIFPPMSRCLNCHEHQEQFIKNDCLPCHRLAQVRTLKPVTFMTHDSAWPRRHGQYVRDDQQGCATCHAQAQCDACHDAAQTIRGDQRNPDAIEKEYVHRFDFLSRHAVESRSRPGTCVTCHAKNDCDACHSQRGVSAGVEFGRNPHPLNWAAGNGAASNQHGREARRDIASCAACHDQGPVTNCVRCHKVGGFGGNPHPPGWQSTQSQDSVACTACHGGMR